MGLVMGEVQVKILPTYAGPRNPDYDPAYDPAEREYANLLAPAQPGDAGVDLYAPNDVVIRPGERVIVGTGLALAIPEGFEAQVRPRSGLAAKRGLTVVNTPGTIDAGFRGEVQVILLNTTPVLPSTVFDKMLDVMDGTAEVADLSDTYDAERAKATVVLSRGDRIAQLVFARYERPEVVVVTELPLSVRGSGKFGSTGK